MAGYAARRWILEVSLDHRANHVFLVRNRKKGALVMWVDGITLGGPLDGHQHVMLPDCSLDSRQRPISLIHGHRRVMDGMPAHYLHGHRIDFGRMLEADRRGL